MKHLLEQKSNVTQLITCLSATALCVIIFATLFCYLIHSVHFSVTVTIVMKFDILLHNQNDIY